MPSVLPRLSTTLFFTLCLAALMGSGTALLSDPDTLWHLAAGDLLRATGHVPQTDPWSFTAGANRWFLLSWLWDAALSQAFAAGGNFGVVLMTSLIYALAFALLFGAARKRCDSVAAPFLVVLLAAAGSTLLARPQCVTLLCTVLFARILHGYCMGQKPARALFFLPPLMMLWVNCHGGFFVGFTVLGAYLIQAWREKRTDQCALLGAATLACVLAALVNPYGAAVAEGAFRSLHGNVNSILGEWQPMRLTFSALIAAPLPLLLIALAPPSDTRAKLAERLLAYAWLLMGLNSMRHLPVCYVLAAPMLAAALDRVFSSRAAHAGWPPLVALNARMETAPMRLLALLAPLLYLAFVLMPYGKEMIGADAYRLPAPLDQEIAYIEAHYPRARLLIDYNFASRFIYDTRGRIPVFIDSRADSVYPPEVSRDYLAFFSAAPGWENMLERRRIDGVLIPSAASRMHPALYDRFAHREGWSKMLETPSTALFMRNAAAR